MAEVVNPFQAFSPAVPTELRWALSEWETALRQRISEAGQLKWTQLDITDGDAASDTRGLVLQAAAVADLTVGSYTVSDPPTQAEVQAIAAGLNAAETAINDLLAALRTAGTLAT